MKNRYDSPDGDSKTGLLRKESLASTHSMNAGQDAISDASPRSAAMDAFPELVTTDWSDDPEMLASETFEAAVELRNHFPNYHMPQKGPKSEDYIRTLCLLEFHQKCQYMVRHLKQYEYLLIRPWPPEHKILAQELCLDRILKLIDLFRSLVACIEQTKTAQGYVGMAEAVLAWLTDNSKANLKTWAQHCQALSCTNMLDCVAKWVRDYAQRHPDIVRLLQTRHNKFVLIDGLKHMRILYFNLPLIANNIVKDLEKKTKSYKAEAKLWQQIHMHLASLPQTIDDVCMPLVKRINSGQLQSNLDRKDAIFKQPNATVTPYHELLLNFPRMVFRYWVVAHAEVAVDRLTVTSVNKVNHDYVRERTDMLVILLHSALLLLVKDNERFVLRTFKATREHTGGGGSGGGSSGQDRSTNQGMTMAERGSLASASFSGPVPATSAQGVSLSGSLGSFAGSATASQLSGTGGTGLVNTVANMAGASISERPSGSGSLKLAPILLLNNMFTSCGEKFGAEHLLNIVSMDPPVLVRLLFFQEKQRQNWFLLLKENSPMVPQLTSAQQRNAMSVRMSKQTSLTHMVPIRIGRQISKEVIEPEAREPTVTEVSEGEEAVHEPRGTATKEDVAESVGGLPPGFSADQKQPTVIEQSDSTSSMEDEISPLDRVNMSINACNRMNQQMQRDLCEWLHVSESDFAKVCQGLQANEPPTLDQLLLLEIDIMNNWLRFLSHTYTMAMRRRDFTRTLKPKNVEDPGHLSGEKDLPEVGKRPSLFSLVESFRSVEQDGPESTEGYGGRARDLIVSNQPLLRPLASSVPNVDQVGIYSYPFPHIRQHGVSVQDSRRSRRPTMRSSSMTEREIGPDRLSIVHMWKLVSQMAHTIRQFTKITAEETHIEEPLRRSISDPDTPISSRLSSIRQASFSKEAAEMRFRDLPPTPNEEHVTLELGDDVAHQVTGLLDTPESAVKLDERTERISPGEFSQTKYSVPSNPRDSVLSPDSDIARSHSIRDSGCLPSATDEDEETQEDLVQDVFLDPIQHCSTPTEDTDQQRTPTTNPETLNYPPLDDLSTAAEEPIELDGAYATKDKSDQDFDGDSQLGELSTQRGLTAEVLVARNDSQKSTTSSGFVED